MLDCHVNAFLIRPGRVLGRRLRPLTLAHLWILEAAGSPYAYNQPPQYQDMVFAVLVISLQPSIARWLIMRPALMRRIVTAWGWTRRKVNPFCEMADFAEYWKAYTATAESWPRDGKSRPSCLPVSINIAWSIIGKVGERRAWSMPLPLAMAYHTAEAECHGIEYATEQDKTMARLNSDLVKDPSNG